MTRDAPTRHVRTSLTSLILCGALGLGCDARFESLRPGPLGDGGTADGGLADNGPLDGGSSDAGEGADADTGALIATGALEGRSGYGASGSVELRRLVDGSLTLRFSDDFRAQGVPSPIALLTTRDLVTGGVQPALGDISLGPMSSVTGAQSYAAPEAGAGALYAFVYCLPFTVEVARAQLEPAP